MIDNNEKEMKAMDLFKAGEGEKAHEVQDEFVAEVLSSGEDYCSCKANCKHHGKCVECVVIHRGHGDHLPNCFRDMVNRRIKAVSELTEHTFKTGNR
jgi:hypothetical protein